MDPELKFTSYSTSLTKTAFYHWKFPKVWSILSQAGAVKLVHALIISSRRDYCNALLAGLPQKTLGRLQFTQNTAARVLTGTRITEHITPRLKTLHWLPMKYRTDFKILLTVYKALKGLASQYISDLLTACRPLKTPSSSETGLLSIRIMQNKFI